MMIKMEYPVGATPLDLDEAEELIPPHITTQKQLNEWEAENISKAESWLTQKSKSDEFLTIQFTKLLHQKMFDDTWKWAGKFRKTLKTIGIHSENIAPELRNLLDNVKEQIINEAYSADEIAYRFHHQLVKIHPFPNGNGRHARLFTDYLLDRLGVARFTWGSTLKDQSRKMYIEALQKADRWDYSDLAKFVRS